MLILYSFSEPQAEFYQLKKLVFPITVLYYIKCVSRNFVGSGSWSVVFKAYGSNSSYWSADRRYAIDTADYLSAVSFTLLNPTYSAVSLSPLSQNLPCLEPRVSFIWLWDNQINKYFEEHCYIGATKIMLKKGFRTFDINITKPIKKILWQVNQGSGGVKISWNSMERFFSLFLSLF